MDNGIYLLANNTFNSIKRLDNSLQIASGLKTDLEGKDEWNLEDWLSVIAAGAYVGISAYNTYQDGKQLFNAITEEKPVKAKVKSNPIPARAYTKPIIRQRVKVLRSSQLLGLPKLKL